jgi:hypothetical protein
MTDHIWGSMATGLNSLITDTEACATRLLDPNKHHLFVQGGLVQALIILPPFVPGLLGGAVPPDDSVRIACPMAPNDDEVYFMRGSPPDRLQGLGCESVAYSSVSAIRIQGVSR